MTTCDECKFKIINEDKMGVRCDLGLPLFPKKDCHSGVKVREVMFTEKRVGLSPETVQILDANKLENESYNATILRMIG